MSAKKKLSGLENIDKQVRKPAINIRKRGISILLKRWNQYLNLPEVYSPLDKKFNDIYLWSLVYRDASKKLKLVKEYSQLAELNEPSADQQKALNRIERALNFKENNNQKGGAIINRLIDFIEKVKANTEEPFDFGLVWNEFAIFEDTNWIVIDPEDMVVFLRSKVIPSLDFAKTEIAGSRVVKDTLEIDFTSSNEFNKIVWIDRKNIAKKIAFLDGTLDPNNLEFELKHSPDDYLLNCLNISFSDFVPLLRKDGEPFEIWLNRVKKWIGDNAPELLYFINTSFKTWIDFINLSEHVVLSLTEIPINLRAFYLYGKSRSGKSTAIFQTKKSLPDYVTTINVRRAFCGKDTDRGDELYNAGACTLLCDPDVSKQPFNEEHLKKGISNEDIKMKILYKQSVKYLITSRYLLASNHILNVNNAGYETKCRIYPIELNTIDKKDIDATLAPKLLEYKKEYLITIFALGYGILKRSDYEYTFNNNVDSLLNKICGNAINQFIDELEIEATEKVGEWHKKEEVYGAFTIYCKDAGIRRVPKKIAFLNDLDSALRPGYPIIGTKDDRIYVPIAKGTKSNVVSITIKNYEDYQSLVRRHDS